MDDAYPLLTRAGEHPGYERAAVAKDLFAAGKD